MQSARPHNAAYVGDCFSSLHLIAAAVHRTSAFSNGTLLEYIVLLLAATLKVYAVYLHACFLALSHSVRDIMTEANNRQYDMKHISSGIAIPGKGALPEASVGICVRVAFVACVSESVSVLQSDLHVREL